MAADTGMDTCPSPEITDSRKRPLDGDSENGDVKRSHFSSGEWCKLYLHNIHSKKNLYFVGKAGITLTQRTCGRFGRTQLDSTRFLSAHTAVIILTYFL